ncbi:hypothetical protein DEJ50_01620 [Streptomyces venezuelae]|uniref:Uncharacterized protein n=1 Tax=Streptomyces venezuelae TaxID=54571 RepID=A0A5P2CV11_STRVZ|nr:hypothetical protein [Streptomyces venezuelae]QES46746.1 hypothetical protein DEJ50_01620 [Streptomyces venezuelae]
MTFLDDRLLGIWHSAPFDVGAMETSELVFLADGRGWSRFESISTVLAVDRFRWHCPGPGRLALRYTWQVSGRWGPGGEGFAEVEHNAPYEPQPSVQLTKYRLAGTGTGPGSAPAALHLDEAIAFTRCFARVRRTATPSDDPSAAVAPYRPAPRPAPPRRTGPGA